MNTEQIRKLWEAYVEVSEKKLDPVNDKELDKKFKDRSDKDIDNDGDVDSSDEYLHNRRKAVDKAIEKEKGEIKESHFKVGQKVRCKASGMTGTVTKVDPEEKGKYYTVKQDSGKVMKYAPDELTAVAKEQEGEGDGDELNTNKHTSDKTAEISKIGEAKMDDSEVLAAAKKLAANGKDEKAKKFGQGLVDFYQKNDGFTPDQVSGLQNIMKNAPFQLAKEEVELEEGFDTWTVTVKKPVNKLKKGQSVKVQARNTSEAMKKALQKWGEDSSFGSQHLDVQKGVKEEVELDEAFKKGDKVKVKDGGKSGVIRTVGTGKTKGSYTVDIGNQTMSFDHDELMKESVELDEAKMSVGDTVRIKDKAKNVVDPKMRGKSGYIKSIRGKDILVKFVDGRSIIVDPQDLEMIKEESLGESFEVLWRSIEEAIASEPKNRKGSATEPEGLLDKESPKSMEFIDKHKKSEKEYEDMPKDAVDKTTAAGRAVKSQSPARSGDNRKGDNNVVNPVKEDTRSERQKIMDILSGKTWNEIAEENLDEE